MGCRYISHHLTQASNIEALLNMAASLYSLNRQAEAEKYWLAVIRIRPQCLEAVEHLVGLLYKRRSKEAVDIIQYIQQALVIPRPASSNGLSVMDGHFEFPDVPTTEFSGWTSEALLSPGICCHESGGFGSSGYSIPGSDNGRMLALIHAKGTMLYSLKDVGGAAEAFEEAVLISTDRRISCINHLVRKIQYVLTPDALKSGELTTGTLDGTPLLLPPHRARHTAQLVFPASGELPGLRYVPDGSPRKAAIQTTSNSLLSLAKIFQDAMSTGTSSIGRIQHVFGVGDILALYYLSLSLQESPSTANNVGILLASVQQASSPYPREVFEAHHHPHIPGIVPGSGLSLALAYYNYGLGIDPKHVHLHTNLGSLLKDIGQLDLAIQMYEQAVACDGTFDIALTNLANAVKDRGRIGDAIMYYKRAVGANPDFAEAVCGLASALNSVCDWRGRGGVLLVGGKYDRWHVDEEGMLHDALDQGQGTGLTNRVVSIVRRQLDDSASWGCGVIQDDIISMIETQMNVLTRDAEGLTFEVRSELRKWSRNPWEGTRLVRLIERITRSMLWLWYHDRHILGSESPAGYPRPRLPSTLTVPAAPTVLPFHTFTCPLTAREIRMISQRNAIRISCSTLRSSWIPTSVYPPPCPPNPHLNVGYVSSDFNNHPLAHL